METCRELLLYSLLINWGVLAVWGLTLILPHQWMYDFAQKRGVRISAEQFDFIAYAGIVFYKSAVLFLNLVPYLVLRFIL
jgi:hypothetical protein